MKKSGNIIFLLRKIFDKKNFLMLCVLLLVTSSILSLKYITGFYQRLLFYPLLAYMYLYVIVKHRKNDIKKNFTIPWIILCITTVTAILTCYIYHDQPFFLSLKATLPYGFVGISYFYLHKKRISERTVLNVIFWLTILVFIIQIIQQLKPSYAIFGVEYYEDTSELVQRNGLYRFRLFSSTFMFPILYLLLISFFRNFKIKLAIILFFLFISLYLFLTRQAIFAALIGLFLGSLFYKLKYNKFNLIITILFIGVGFIYFFDILFSEIVEYTNDQLSDDSYVRYLSFEYFGKESIRTPYLFLFGNGVPGKGSVYESQILRLASDMRLYAEDVGFIGAGYRFGYIHVFSFLWICYIILWKKQNLIPAYLKMVVIGVLTISIMIFPFARSFGWVYWGMLLYVCDLHINKSDLCCVKE